MLDSTFTHGSIHVWHIQYLYVACNGAAVVAVVYHFIAVAFECASND